MKWPMPLSPMTPPVAAHPRIASSRMLRPRCVRVHGLECEKITGFVETSNASIEVRWPQCDASTTMPTRFISATTARPKSVRPTSAPWQPPPALLSRL